MKTLKFADEEQWLEARRGKITGSRISGFGGASALTKDSMLAALDEAGVEIPKAAKKEELQKLLSPETIAKIKLGGEKGIEFYELLAERIAIPADGENALDRGHRLEEEAIDRFMEETGKKVDKSLQLWIREDNENIAVSPDGQIGKTEACEVKCLKSALHIKAILTEAYPKEYEDQILQYFVVNDKLRKLYFIMYDPRMPRDFIYFTIERKDVQERVEEYLEYERQVLEQIAEAERLLTF